MSRKITQFTKLARDLARLQIGDTLSHSVDLQLRQAAYDFAKLHGVSFCIQRVPTKAGRFMVTRIK